MARSISSTKTFLGVFAVLLSLCGCANTLPPSFAENFSTSAPDLQAIDIERTLGDPSPKYVVICIDRKNVASLRKGEQVRVFLGPGRAHDVYVVTRGRTDCDVNQVLTTVSIPTETPVLEVGVERDDSIKTLKGVKR